MKFDVSMPVRRVKVVNLPNGGQTNVLYDFEKFQKMCYTCQRLTHEQDKCPLFLCKEVVKGVGIDGKGIQSEPFLKEGDPLFGVLNEDQVGLSPDTGRMRIAKDVLDGMRVYLMISSGPERIIKEERVRRSVEDILNDPRGNKASLTLEPIPTISTDIDKGKGIVFGYDKREERNQGNNKNERVCKLLKDAIVSGSTNSRKVMYLELQDGSEQEFLSLANPSNYDSPTDYRIGFSETGSSRKSKRKGKPRKRPHMSRRKPKVLDKESQDVTVELKEGESSGQIVKRKALLEVEDVNHEAPHLKTMAVPNEGLSSSQ